jgi:hypothetical protein
MRRVAVTALGVLAILWVATPASAFAHDRVANPYLHMALDVLVLAAVTAPLWTAYLWGGTGLSGRERRNRRALLLALVTVVQVPVAVVAFVPIIHPGVHAAALAGALALTVASLAYTRRSAPAAAAPEPA